MRPSSDRTSAKTIPRHDLIARRAYALWVERGRREGEAEADWLAAEAELRELDRQSDEPPRDVDEDTPITLDSSDAISGDDEPHGEGNLPPPHRR